MKFLHLCIVWTEGKNLSVLDLLSRSLTTTTQDEHRLRIVEIPDSINFFMTHNQHTQPIQCPYALSKEYVNTITTDTAVESPHFPTETFNYFYNEQTEIKDTLLYEMQQHGSGYQTTSSLEET